MITEEQKNEISTSHHFLVSVNLEKLKDMGILEAYLERRAKKYEDFADTGYYDHITIFQAQLIGFI